MQIERLEITGLFNHFDHVIHFPRVIEGQPRKSLLILLGPNGVGKTTALHMLDALLGSNDESRFNVFKRTPFKSCVLKISSLDPFVVTQDDDGTAFRYGNKTAVLSSGRPSSSINIPGYRETIAQLRLGLGEADSADAEAQALHTAFRTAARDLSFEFIQTARLNPPTSQASTALYTLGRSLGTEKVLPTLPERMERFITSAQLSYANFFSTHEPDLFQRVMERINDPRTKQPAIKAEALLGRLEEIRRRDGFNQRFGLQADRWSPRELRTTIENIPRSGPRRSTALLVADQYLQVLEERARARGLLAARLATFETVMKGFYAGKNVTVASKYGLKIETDDGAQLDEDKLSSGERHLLYLMVSATVARRIGTVIAIDEPEMSMHIAWQRKLIPGLLQCAAYAAPQFVFATHSPQIAAEYPESLCELA